MKIFGSKMRGALTILFALHGIASAQVPRDFVERVRNSGFIFLGTVRQLHAATPTVVLEPNTVVVSVDRIIESLPPIGNVSGKVETVRLREGEKVAEGQQLIFFTYLYSAGTSLGLQSVGILPAMQDIDAAVQEVKTARITLADEALSNRLTSASIVVLGRVVESQPNEEARERKAEHDPMWWRADIEVESVLKGAAERKVSVNFASSDDWMWVHSPKPKRGETAIFLLQPAKNLMFNIGGLYLLDPLDELPRQELARVKRLLAQ